jgi:rubrerythrin
MTEMQRRTLQARHTEAVERMREHNKSAAYTGKCRQCNEPWEGKLSELWAQCPKCGLKRTGSRDGR